MKKITDALITFCVTVEVLYVKAIDYIAIKYDNIKSKYKK